MEGFSLKNPTSSKNKEPEGPTIAVPTTGLSQHTHSGPHPDQPRSRTQPAFHLQFLHTDQPLRGAASVKDGEQNRQRKGMWRRWTPY